MHAVSLRDKGEIERFLRKNIYLHLYGLGDLDEFFWPYTMWFGSRPGDDLVAVALLYTGQALPALLALSEQPDSVWELLESAAHLLPSRFYAHLSPGIHTVFGRRYHVEPHGEHYKMGLLERAAVMQFDCTGADALGTAELKEIVEFYAESYPRNWFDPRMLETNQYFGIREGGRLVSVGGIHVYSPEYRVASLGNIATLPSHRRKGYAKKVTAKICQSLARDVEHIGLNVKADNHAALSCYRSLGFEVVASYGEFMISKK